VIFKTRIFGTGSKLSGWVGLFPDLPFTGLRRKLFACGLKFRVVMSGTYFAKPRQVIRAQVGLKMTREGVEGSEGIRTNGLRNLPLLRETISA